MTDLLIPLPALLLGWMVAAGSPGPATLAISGTSMGQGRASGMALALGIVAGSASWGVAAALGFSALMVANAWLFEVLRHAGAAYLLYLALKSLWSAWRNRPAAQGAVPRQRFFLRGLLIHLTNPKAMLAWGAIYAIALPAGSGLLTVWQVFAMLASVSAVMFLGYAWVFSVDAISTAYACARRWFELAFGLLFGAASLRILTLRLET
ncbi:MAG: LysE family transporter [Salibaculum sp.]|uniref:LysE family translocator n=1 Tax=Salibaculum sp. TaxID=2855480 RepID=UPI00286FCD8E|nr:LysE family transporter [Salibaculum sp.]MDR9426837.1 LysE family transporter [Salibaculum sp.]MDR9481390.1 LysE family transporter [Salibaculum sp.]